MRQVTDKTFLKKLAISSALSAIVVACYLPSSSLQAASPSSDKHSYLQAVEWLSRMNTALQNSAYQGYFLFENQDNLQTFRISSSSIDAQKCERLISLDGPHREMIRYGNKVAHISEQDHPASKVAKPSLFPSFKPDFKQLKRYYDLRYTGEQRISDRISAHIEVSPRDNNRYGYQVWIDKDTGLLLKWIMMSSDNKLLERFQFTLLDPNSELFESDCSLPAGHQWVDSTIDNNDKKIEAFPWKLNWLPEGYNLIYGGKAVNPISKAPSDYALYSDSLSNFSIMIEVDMSKNENERTRERLGATGVVTHVLHYEHQTYLVTIIGEMPLTALERIAVSVTSTENSH